MYKTRLQFSKTGRAKFLSHLDVMRIIQRALTRAEAPVMYSNGFNPHMRLSVAFPLPLGSESECELLDIQLEYPCAGLTDKLNRVLPEGIRFTGVLPLNDIASITHIKYMIVFDRDVSPVFCGQPLVIQKKTKSGIAALDITPHIKNASVTGCTLTAELSSANPTISPSHTLEAVRLSMPDAEIISSKRMELVYI